MRHKWITSLLSNTGMVFFFRKEVITFYQTHIRTGMAFYNNSNSNYQTQLLIQTWLCSISDT